MKVIAFNGSARKDGNTSIILNIVLDEIKSEGIETEIKNLAGERIQGCIACYKCFENKNMKCAIDDDVVNDYFNLMYLSQGILLGSPTYFADISTNLKALIERCGMVSRANNDLLKRKVGAAVIAVRRAGAIHAFTSINYFFLIGQMIVPGSSYWNIAIGREPGDVKSDTEGIQTMRTLGINMSWLLKKINA
ncbi:MAG: flavodoxin family protein [Candidatus Schekmanbacteria bacterium]|nr:flavodoxin family protein [Candidatus Schekmanbacteria bacterium]